MIDEIIANPKRFHTGMRSKVFITSSKSPMFVSLFGYGVSILNGAVRCEDLRPDVDWAFLWSGK